MPKKVVTRRQRKAAQQSKRFRPDTPEDSEQEFESALSDSGSEIKVQLLEEPLEEISMAHREMANSNKKQAELKSSMSKAKGAQPDRKQSKESMRPPITLSEIQKTMAKIWPAKNARNVNPKKNPAKQLLNDREVTAKAANQKAAKKELIKALLEKKNQFKEETHLPLAEIPARSDDGRSRYCEQLTLAEEDFETTAAELREQLRQDLIEATWRCRNQQKLEEEELQMPAITKKNPLVVLKKAVERLQAVPVAAQRNCNPGKQQIATAAKWPALAIESKEQSAQINKEIPRAISPVAEIKGQAVAAKKSYVVLPGAGPAPPKYIGNTDYFILEGNDEQLRKQLDDLADRGVSVRSCMLVPEGISQEVEQQLEDLERNRDEILQKMKEKHLKMKPKERRKKKTRKYSKY